jgi:hypothetical protein
MKRSDEKQKEMMGSKQERKRNNGKWKDIIENNERDEKNGIMRSNRKWNDETKIKKWSW